MKRLSILLVVALLSACGEKPASTEEPSVETPLTDTVESLLADPERIKALDLRLALSHLASSEETETPSNQAQLARFAQVAAALPGRPLQKFL